MKDHVSILNIGSIWIQIYLNEYYIRKLSLYNNGLFEIVLLFTFYFLKFKL